MKVLVQCVLSQMVINTVFIHVTAKHQMILVEVTNHLMWFSCSSIFSWTFLMSAASFIHLSCRLLLSQEMADSTAEDPQIIDRISRWECLIISFYLPSLTSLMVGLLGSFIDNFATPESICSSSLVATPDVW